MTVDLGREFILEINDDVYKEKAIGERGQPCGNPMLHGISVGRFVSKKIRRLCSKEDLKKKIKEGGNCFSIN
jgi:hypothetical protein